MQIATFTPISNGALKSKTLPSEIKVLSYGVTETLDDPIKVNEKTKEVFYLTQKSIGRERVPLDFNHNSVRGSKAYEDDKEPRAIAGYGTPELREDGIWLKNITWTPSGEKSAKDYEDLSPAPLLDDDNNVVGLHSVALTPAGAISNLHFYSATEFDKIMKKPSMELSAEDTKLDKLEEHLKEDVKEQEKGIEKDKESLKDIEKMEEEHEEYCMCDECSDGMKQEFFTKQMSLGTDPFGELTENKIIKTMSAVELPAAYLTEPQTTKTFRNYMDEKIKQMAAELNLPDAAELEKRLKAWLAEWIGQKSVPSPITGDPKPAQFSAQVAELENRIKNLEADRNEQIARFSAIEKKSIVDEATKNGKVVPFSAEEIAELSPKTLKSVIDKLPATVPMVSKTKVLSADGKSESKVTLSDAAKAIQAQVESALAKE